MPFDPFGFSPHMLITKRSTMRDTSFRCNTLWLTTYIVQLNIKEQLDIKADEHVRQEIF